MTIPYLNLQALQARFKIQDEKSLQQLVASGQYIGGEAVNHFEESFASYCGVNHCIGTGNGLDALTLILKAEQQLGRLPENAKVLVPAHTYIATFLSIIHAGLLPVLVDVSEITISCSDIEPFIKDIDAIVVVDIYGKLVDDGVYAFAKAKQIPIYCDAAQSHGATNNRGKVSGSLAKASAFSFYPTKNLGALGDAGAVTTNDEKLASMLRSMANYGRVSRFKNTVKGVNSRLDPLQALFLLSRLHQLNDDNYKRYTIAQKYLKHLNNELIQLVDYSFIEHNSIHVFPIFCEKREELVHHLDNYRIGYNFHYKIPPHLQTALSEYNHMSFARTELLHKTQLSLPCHPLLNNDEVNYIIDAINSFL